DFDEYNFLFRVLIGAYVMGFSQIIIKSSKKFEPFIRDCVIDFTQIVIGPEIIEESETYFLIKDLLNPKEMPFNRTIKRMYIIAETMHKDALTALKTRDKALAEDIIGRDNDIDRLHWLIARQSSIVLRDIILSQKLGISLDDAKHYQFMSKFLERIGDHAVKIAQNVLHIIDVDLDENLIQKIENASKVSIELLNNSQEARLKKDIKMANENISRTQYLVKMCEGINIDSNTYSVETSIALSYILESIRRTGEYSGDISELVINNLLKE
ncbi:MAG: phosphate uptake regulator PhoU, partial [Candidatus Lokiarchaeota archaeon]